MENSSFKDREDYRRYLKSLRDNLTYAYRHRHLAGWAKRARYSLWKLRTANMGEFLEDNFILSRFAQ